MPGIPTETPDTKAPAASAAGIANIAPTETPTARATVAALFSIQRERSNQSTARNAPVHAIHARTAAIQPTTANAQEDAATALHAIRAKPTAIRTFAVFFQISRSRSVFESAAPDRPSDCLAGRAHESDAAPFGRSKFSSFLKMAMGRYCGYPTNLSPAVMKTQEKFRKSVPL